MEEPLIFEIGATGQSPASTCRARRRSRRASAASTRKAPIGLPGLSEPETVRHYVRLSQKNYAIDLGLFRSARAR